MFFLQHGVFGHQGLDRGYQVGFLFFRGEGPPRRLEVVGSFVPRGGLDDGDLGNLHD